jgi:hypothetical protein
LVRRLRCERGGDRHDGAKIPYPLLAILQTDPSARIGTPRRSGKTMDGAAGRLLAARGTAFAAGCR